MAAMQAESVVIPPATVDNLLAKEVECRAGTGHEPLVFVEPFGGDVAEHHIGCDGEALGELACSFDETGGESVPSPAGHRAELGYYDAPVLDEDVGEGHHGWSVGGDVDRMIGDAVAQSRWRVGGLEIPFDCGAADQVRICMSPCIDGDRSDCGQVHAGGGSYVHSSKLANPNPPW